MTFKHANSIVLTNQDAGRPNSAARKALAASPAAAVGAPRCTIATSTRRSPTQLASSVNRYLQAPSSSTFTIPTATVQMVVVVQALALGAVNTAGTSKALASVEHMKAACGNARSVASVPRIASQLSMVA